MKFVVDMNLSPKWSELLRASGYSAVHWAEVGPTTASDREIAAWAVTEGRIILTADLDFGSMLAATGAGGPSVVQLRSDVLRPSVIGNSVLEAVAAGAAPLKAGAFMTFDGQRARIRSLPLQYEQWPEN